MFNDLGPIYCVGVYGHTEHFIPYLLTVHPIELENGQLRAGSEYTQKIFSEMPEEVRFNPKLDQWCPFCTTPHDPDDEEPKNTYLTALYFSRDFEKIYDILNGMMYTFDVTFNPGIKIKESLKIGSFGELN